MKESQSRQDQESRQILKWVVIWLIISIGLTIFLSSLVYSFSFSLLLALGDYELYTIPIGALVFFILFLIVGVIVVFALVAFRGWLLSKNSEEEFRALSFHKVFGGILIFLGIFYTIFFIALLSDINWSYILSLIREDSAAASSYIQSFSEFTIIVVAAVVGLLVYGVRSIKGVSFSKSRFPHKLSKIVSVFVLFLVVLSLIAVPFIAGNPYKPLIATIPKSYPDKIGPVLQFGPADEDHHLASPAHNIAIWWFTPTETEEEQYVLYGTSPDTLTMKQVYEVPGGDHKYHLVYLTDLEANTRYYYTIPGFNSTIYNFTTAPEDKSTFRFVCVGDTRNSGGTSPSYYGYINHAITNFYNSIGEDWAFKINVGDIPSRGTDLESWKVYFDDIAVDNQAATHAHMIALGNHELGGDNGANYDYVYEHPRYYSFDYGNAHFVMIHTFDTLYEIVGRSQLEWLKQDLAANMDKKFIIVSFHVPPLSTGDFNMNELLQKQLIPIFNEYHVDLVLTGHDHHYDSFWVNPNNDWNGTFYFVNGGGGSPLDHYIMTRQEKQWKTWYHNRSSEYGLYQNDTYTLESHIYGELSHGFMDIIVSEDTLTMTYYRFLSLEKYFEITNQTHSNYHLVYFTPEQIEQYNLTTVEWVHTLQKTRVFAS